MKEQDLLTLGAAAILAYVAWKTFKRTPPVAGANTITTTRGGNINPSGVQAANGFALSIANSALPGNDAWGWSYFTDGTAIDPAGNYYKNGALVWSPQ